MHTVIQLNSGCFAKAFYFNVISGPKKKFPSTDNNDTTCIIKTGYHSDKTAHANVHAEKRKCILFPQIRINFCIAIIIFIHVFKNKNAGEDFNVTFCGTTVLIYLYSIPIMIKFLSVYYTSVMMIIITI